MKKVFLFFSFFFLIFVTPVFAQNDSGWVIENFHSDIDIKKTGVVIVVETLGVDFRTFQKHGIFREIPYIYDKKDGSTYYTEVLVDSVTQDGSAATYSVTTNGSFQEIKIGDSNKTISGKHIYVITYTVKGVLQGFSEYDELYWNVTGNRWPIFIDRASASVTLPPDVPLFGKQACYQGVEGSTTQCLAEKGDDHTVQFATTGLLGSNEGMTVGVAYPSHMIPLITVARPKTFLEKFLSYPSEMTLLSVIACGLFISLFLWLRYGRDFWISQSAMYTASHPSESIKPIGAKETTVVEFTPPDDLRPAQIGVLMDEKADTLDITATIIDLTARGYLTITEIPKKWLFGSIDYELKRTKKSDADLLKYEVYLLDSIFGEGDTKKVSAMKNTFYTKLAKVKDMVYQDMVDKKYFVENPQKVRSLYTGIAIAVIAICFFGIFYSIGNDMVTITDIALGGLIGGMFLIIFAQFMGRRTAKGRTLYLRIKGYKMFVNTAERYKQRFFEQHDLFNQVLPYAIVFGLTKKFAQAMKDIGLEDAHIVGYYGTTPFNAYTFTNNVNIFSSSFSSASASAPSSSGSGGGGSSGGGFGGGGGGSW